MKLFTIISLMAVCFYCQTTFAQSYCGLTYSYDPGGNRIKREVTTDCPEEGGGGNSGKRDMSEDTTNINVDDLTQSLFPNPTSGAVNIVFNQPVADAQVTVTDNAGKRLFVSAISGNSALFDFSGYASGVYFVIIKTDRKVFRNTVVRE